MSDITKILDAFAALANALPNGGYTTINLHQCSDAALAAYVAAGGTEDTNANERGTEEWDVVELRRGQIRITAYGLHRPVVRAASIDRDAATAALAQAQEALS
jgi:hypothetical protein